MAPQNDKVLCETPTPGKKPTRIDRWKYHAVRKAILKVLPKRGEGLPFAELPARVAAALPKPQAAELGSINWYTTVVKLALEVRGEIRRVEGSKPQRLLRGA